MTEIRPATPTTATPELRRPGAADTPEARQRVAREFEGQVIGALLQPMFSGLATKGPLGGGAAEEMWRPMLVQEFGNAVARAGGVGIAAAVAREMERNGR
jgi:Rod binding domain-containing protein